jgi:hypothetical protein
MLAVVFLVVVTFFSLGVTVLHTFIYIKIFGDQNSVSNHLAKN